jgi:protein tyrosine phosphatase
MFPRNLLHGKQPNTPKITGFFQHWGTSIMLHSITTEKTEILKFQYETWMDSYKDVIS